MPPRLPLAHLPTPIVRDAHLSDMLGVELWIKRDDATGGAEAGNKIRKLEFLFADAKAKGAKRVVTCGGLQSNHARATAILARRLELAPTLLLRLTPEEAALGELPMTGNVLLDLLVGADIRAITPLEWAHRDELMAEAASQLGDAYVIPEGGSNGLGSLGYVEAMRETREQADPFDVCVVVHVRLGWDRGGHRARLRRARYGQARARGRRVRRPRLLRACGRAHRRRGACARRSAAPRPAHDRRSQQGAALRSDGRGAARVPRAVRARLGAHPRPRLHRQGDVRPARGKQPAWARSRWRTRFVRPCRRPAQVSSPRVLSSQ